MALNYIFIGFFSIAFVMAVFQYFYHGIDIFSLLVQRTFDDAGTAAEPAMAWHSVNGVDDNDNCAHLYWLGWHGRRA